LLAKAPLERAVDLYKRLVEGNPNDARAWAGLARARAVQGSYGFEDAESSTNDAKAAAAKAVELDPQLSEAHLITGWLQMSWDLRWAESGASFRRARELSPSSGGPVIGLGTWHAERGELDAAIALGREAIELDPLSPTSYQFLGRFLLWTGDFAGARAMFAKAIDLSPGVVASHSATSLTYTLEGNLEQARIEAEKEASLGYRSCALAIYHSVAGNDAESRSHLDTLISLGEEWAAQIAMVHAMRGEADESFRWLEKGRDLHDTGVPTAKVQPYFRSLYGDPRWKPFLASLGLEP
jgi:tetratricopeptide (TPR) repeat protein